MIAVSVVVLVDICIRWDADGASTGLMTALSVIAGSLVSVGATFGGSLVFDYGFNVETAGDHPVWHQSEEDVFPGKH